jgi:translocation and assembly module TamB
MQEAKANSGKGKRARRWVLGGLIAAAVLLALVVVGPIWLIRTPGFQSWLRTRFAVRLEQITGGRVELGGLAWDLGKLQFEARNLTIHGLEPAGEVPYAHVDRLAVGLKILSLFRREVGLRYVELDRPVIHLIVYPDGSTNQPAPWRPAITGDSPIEQLFAIDVNQAEIHDGWVLVNQHSWRVDGSAKQIAFFLSYMAADKRYAGDLRLGKIEIASGGMLGLPGIPASTVPDWIQRPDDKSGARPDGSAGTRQGGSAGLQPGESSSASRAALAAAGSSVAEGRRPTADGSPVANDQRPTTNDRFFGSAAAQFSLWRDHVRVDSLHLVTGHSQLQAKGEIQDFNHPVAQGSYSVLIDGPELGAALRLPGLRAGRFSVDGQIRGTAQAFASSGKVAVRDLEYKDRSLWLAPVSGGALFTVTNDRLALPHIFLSTFGGTATGDMEIQHWRSAGDSKMVAAQTGSVHLLAHDWLLSRVASAAATPIIPLERLKAAGTASGSVSSHWRGSPANLITELSFVVAAPANPLSGELALNAQLNATHDNAAGTFRIDRLTASTSASQLNAAGVMDLGQRTRRRHFGVDVALTTQNLPEVELVMGVLTGPPTLPVDLHGRASIRGVWTGGIDWPRLTGHIDASDVDSLIVVGAGPRRVHWDTVSGDVEFSPVVLAAHHADLRRGTSQVDADGSVNITKSLDETSPFTVQAGFHNVDVADVFYATGTDAHFLTRNSQLAGRLTADLNVSGTGAHPQARAHVVATEARVYGQPVQRLSGDVQFAQGEVDIKAIQITQNGATVTGTANVNPDTTAYRFDLRGHELNLSKLRGLQRNHLAVAGKLDFVASGQGTRAAPALNAEVQLKDLTVNGERMGAIGASAVTTGDTLQLAAHSALPQSTWSLGGTANMRGDFPAKLEMVCQHVNLAPWLHMFWKDRVIGNSAVTGKFSLEGPLRSPRDLVLTGDLDGLLLDVEHVQLHNDGPVRFTLAHQILHVRQLQVSGTNTALAVGGDIQLTGDRELDVEAKGQVDLKLLESLDPTSTSRGTLTLDLRANGTMDRPLIRGRLDVANAAYSQVDLPNGLSELNGHLVFNEDRLQVRSLSGKTGGGTLDIGGYIAYGRGISYNLNARGHNIRLRYPPGVSSMAEVELRMTGSPQNALLAGDITVTRFEVNAQFDFASYLAKSRPVTAVNPDALLSRLRLDVHLASTPELQVQTSTAKVSGDLDLRLRGTEVRPVLLGRVNITEGDISFNGTKYHMERGGITFSNPVTIDPVLDIEATTTVRDYDINLGLHGPLDKLSTTYRSDPPLATADIVSLLAFGRVREDLAMQSASASNLTPEAQSVLYQALNAAVSSRMQKLFGVSRIKIDPQAGGAENSTAGPRLTIEQQVANNITLTYITDVTRANYQTIQAEYNINRNLSLIAIRDWNGVVSFDVRIRQRRK